MITAAGLKTYRKQHFNHIMIFDQLLRVITDVFDMSYFMTQEISSVYIFHVQDFISQ